MTDIVSKYLASGRHTVAEIKAAYVTACNAYEGTAFREAVCSLSPRHAKLMEQAIAVKATTITGQYTAWAKALKVTVGNTDFMRGLVEDENRRLAARHG